MYPTIPGLLTLPGNRFAFAAGVAAAALPGNTYNPLWIYGPTGTGKSALLQAMLRQSRSSDPQLRIRYVHAEEFVQELCLATKKRTVDEFRAALNELDILMVDDLDLLQGMSVTQDTVGHIFSNLAAGGCQVVLASCLSPDQLNGLKLCLARRCEFALWADISLPAPRERLALTRYLARELAVPLTGSMAPRIAFAGRTPGEIRHLLAQLAYRRELLGPDAEAPETALDRLLAKEAAV